ncbi:MAG: LamG domain-containing protein, partial [Chloroflexia bacterium]|nr:LamG domain-containing protein [Chloroflexia bacterium]
RGGWGGSYVNAGTNLAYFGGNGGAGGFYNSGGWTGSPGIVIIRESGKAPLSCPETTSIAATFFAVCATPMKNVTNKQSWLDQSGSSLNFTAYEGSSTASSVNGPQLSSLNSGAYVFDGINDYFSRPMVTNSKSNVTLQATFNTTDATKLGQLVAYNGSDAYGNGYGLAVNSDSVLNSHLWVLYGGILWYDTGFTINSNTWYNAVMVISGTSLKVYVDGTLIYNATASAPNTPSLKTEIGRRQVKGETRPDKEARGQIQAINNGDSQVGYVQNSDQGSPAFQTCRQGPCAKGSRRQGSGQSARQRAN